MGELQQVQEGNANLAKSGKKLQNGCFIIELLDKLSKFSYIHQNISLNYLPFKSLEYQLTERLFKSDFTRYDPQRRFLAQHSVPMLEQCCATLKIVVVNRVV